MNKQRAFLIFESILMFYNLDSYGFIKRKLGLSDDEVRLASKIFRELRFSGEAHNE